MTKFILAFIATGLCISAFAQGTASAFPLSSRTLGHVSGASLPDSAFIAYRAAQPKELGLTTLETLPKTEGLDDNEWTSGRCDQTDLGQRICEVRGKVTADATVREATMTSIGGTLYAAWTVPAVPVKGARPSNLFVARSTDGGSSWEPGIKIEGAEVGSGVPALAASQLPPPFDDEMVLAWHRGTFVAFVRLRPSDFTSGISQLKPARELVDARTSNSSIVGSPSIWVSLLEGKTVLMLASRVTGPLQVKAARQTITS